MIEGSIEREVRMAVSNCTFGRRRESLASLSRDIRRATVVKFTRIGLHSSDPADWPNDLRILPCKLELLLFMADCKAFTLA